MLIFKITATKVIVATGMSPGEDKSTEVINLSKAKCRFLNPVPFWKLGKESVKLTNLSLPMNVGACGGFIQGHPVICGGSNHFFEGEIYQDIVVIGKPGLKLKTIEKRAHASCVNWDENTLWVVGGFDKFGDNENPDTTHIAFTEFIKLDKPPKVGPQLTFSVAAHTMVKCENFFLIIGGIQSVDVSSLGDVSNRTWIITYDMEIKEGPFLNTARAFHSSALMEVDGKTCVVVVGGRGGKADNYSKLMSVEILNIDSNEGWKYGNNTKLAKCSILFAPILLKLTAFNHCLQLDYA